jgi:hypothetical protein
VFLDFRQVQDDDERNYARLSVRLQGGGVPSIDDALREMALEPLLTPFRELVNPGMFDWLIQNRAEADTFNPVNFKLALDETEQKYQAVLQSILEQLEQEPGTEPDQAHPVAPAEAEMATQQAEAPLTPEAAPAGEEGAALPEVLAPQVCQQVKTTLELSTLMKGLAKGSTAYRRALEYLLAGPGGTSPLDAGLPVVWGVLLGSLFAAPLGRLSGEANSAERSRAWLDEWLLGKQIVAVLKEMKVEAGAAVRNLPLLRLLVGQAGWLSAEEPAVLAQRLLQGWVKDDDARRYLKVHPYEGALWYNKECFEELVWWSYALEIITLRASKKTAAEFTESVKTAYAVVQLLLAAELGSGYQLDKLGIE